MDIKQTNVQKIFGIAIINAKKHINRSLFFSLSLQFIKPL
jgi:hypothetical protein